MEEKTYYTVNYDCSHLYTKQTDAINEIYKIYQQLRRDRSTLTSELLLSEDRKTIFCKRTEKPLYTVIPVTVAVQNMSTIDLLSEDKRAA